MSNITPQVKAYIAGLLDGEGFLGINKITSYYPSQKRRKNPNYNIRIEITNNDINMLNFVQKFYSGKIKKSHNAFAYRLCSQKAVKLLKDVLPYLITKQEKAIILLTLNKNIQDYKGKRIPTEVLLFRENLYQSLRPVRG